MAEPAQIERVAFLGLGIMGAPMAANLRRAGFEMIVWNRTRARAERFASEHGGRLAETPADAATVAQAVITMVVDAPEVEAVLFGPGGAAAGLGEDVPVVDMSTIAPSASRAIADRLRREPGTPFLDAPVTGSRPKAEAGTLTIMVGGEGATLERVRPLLDALGERVVHAGPQGHGSMAKLLNNTLAAVNAAAVAEALEVADSAGLDPDALLEVVAAGSGASVMLELKAGPMRERDYAPLFKLEHMLKDVRHLLAEARTLGARTPTAETVERLYAEAESAGLGERDFAAVREVFGGDSQKNP